MRPHDPGQVREWRVVGGEGSPSAVRRPPPDRIATVLEDFTGVGRQEGVAGPAFTALERLEEEPEPAAMELLEGGDRRVAIEKHLAGDRHDAPLRCAPGKVLEAVHFGPATT